MIPAVLDASARQHSGGPLPVRGRGSDRTNRPGRAEVAEVDQQIAELVERSTHELRLAWRQLHRTEPPQGFSRDLLIRALAHQLQERTRGGASRALRRGLQRLTGEWEKDSCLSIPASSRRSARIRQRKGDFAVQRLDQSTRSKLSAPAHIPLDFPGEASVAVHVAGPSHGRRPAWPQAPGLRWCKHRDRRDADPEERRLWPISKPASEQRTPEGPTPAWRTSPLTKAPANRGGAHRGRRRSRRRAIQPW